MNAWPRIIAVTTLATLAVTAAPRALTADSPSVAYPVDYRSWTHVKSMIIQPDHPLADPFEGLHHIYANAAALEGYRSGQFPDGAVIVFDLLAVSAADGAIVEAGRKLVGVMEKDTERFAATGGWGYEGFAGDSRDARLVTDGGAGCLGCHTAQRESDYVFSAWRD
jgi:hypothetical protein